MNSTSLVHPILLSTLLVLVGLQSGCVTNYAIDSRFGGGPDGATTSPPRNVAQIATGTEGSRATLRYAMDRSRLQVNEGKTDLFSVALSSPVDKSDQDTELATLDGLADTFTLSINYTRYSDSIRRDADALRALRQKIWNDSGDFNLALSPNTISSVYENDEEREEMLRQLRSVFQLRRSIFFSAEGSIGRKKFNFVDFSEFKRDSQHDVGWSIGVRGGRTFGSWILAGELRVEHEKKNMNTLFKCKPIIDSENLDCLSGPSGKPVDSSKRLAGIELRKQIGRVGISPSIRFDFEKEVMGIDVPVFIWQNSNEQLTGGVRVGWRDDTDSVNVGLFVATPWTFY